MARAAIREINVNVIPGGAPPVVYFTQFEENATLKMNIWQGDEPFYTDAAVSMSVQGEKPDGKVFDYAVTERSSGSVYRAMSAMLIVPQNALAVEGTVRCKLKIALTYSDSGDYPAYLATNYSASFILSVERAVIGDNADPSETELPAIIEAAERARDEAIAAVAAANQAIAAANQAMAAITYATLNDKPSINGVTLSGNKTSDDLNITASLPFAQKNFEYTASSGRITGKQFLGVIKYGRICYLVGALYVLNSDAAITLAAEGVLDGLTLTGFTNSEYVPRALAFGKPSAIAAIESNVTGVLYVEVTASGIRLVAKTAMTFPVTTTNRVIRFAITYLGT